MPTETHFTPGPWVVNRGKYAFISNGLYRGQIAALGSPPDESLLMVCTPNNVGVADKEMLPNAYLLAAAPDLYVALEHLLGTTDLMTGTIEKAGAREMARAALAKATPPQDVARG